MSQMSMKNALESSTIPKMETLDWFLEPQFYLVCCLYMSARMFINVSQSYITFYVQYTLFLSQDMVAIIPMVLFLSGFAISMVLNFIVDRFGYKISFIGACVVGIGNKAFVD